MFRHVALFRFTDDATDDHRQAVVDRLQALPPLIPELLDYRVGPDAGLRDDTFDFAVVADFADEAGYRAYADHPDHVAAAREVVQPITAERAAVQYEC